MESMQRMTAYAVGVGAPRCAVTSPATPRLAARITGAFRPSSGVRTASFAGGKAGRPATHTSMFVTESGPSPQPPV